MSLTITKPEPLDAARWYTRAERQAWDEQMHAYEQSQREAAAPAPAPAVKEESPVTREMTEEEYNALKRAQWERTQELQRERAEAAQAAATARQEFLASQPEQVTVSASNPHSFLVEFQHRVSQGYRLPDDGMGPFNFNYYSVTMTKPVAPAARIKTTK